MKSYREMLVGFDGKRAMSNMTGLGNYSRLVIEALAKEYTDSKFFVYTPSVRENPRMKKLLDRYGNVELRLPQKSFPGGSLWRTFGITGDIKKDCLTIYHGLSNELPLNIRKSGVPSVLTMHDVIYRRCPDCYSFADRMMYDFKYGSSCRNASRIIAVSERTKQDVVELYGIDPDKIDVVYQGCDDSFKKDIDSQELSRIRPVLGLPDKYILQVGTIEKRKNLELTVRALSALPQDVSLVVVGKDRNGYKEFTRRIAEELGVAGRIIYRHDITFKDLPAVTRMAEVIVYPSRYEGFGIPVIEGLESRRPVVAATGSCLEEAGGDAAVYVDPDNVRQLAEALNLMLRGGSEVDERIERGLRYASRFDNSKMAENIMSVYEKTLGNMARM